MAHYQPQVYDCQIVAQGFTNSSTKGTPGFYLDFQPEGGEYIRKITLWITEKTVDKLVDWLGSQGVTVDKWSDLDPESGDHTSLVGTTSKFECKHERSQDGSKVYEKWDIPFVGGLMPVKPMEKSAVRALDRAFSSALKSLKKTNGKPVQQAAKPKPAESTASSVDQDAEDMPEVGDDIPFSWLIMFALASSVFGMIC